MYWVGVLGGQWWEDKATFVFIWALRRKSPGVLESVPSEWGDPSLSCAGLSEQGPGLGSPWDDLAAALLV